MLGYFKVHTAHFLDFDAEIVSYCCSIDDGTLPVPFASSFSDLFVLLPIDSQRKKANKNR